MVWLRRSRDYSEDDCRRLRNEICRAVDPQTAQQIDSVLRHAGSRGLTKDDLKWLIQIPALRNQPRFIHGLNRYISQSELWVSCSDDAPVNFIAILDRDRATIYGFTGSRHPPPIMSSSQVAQSVRDDRYWNDTVLRECERNLGWASCLLEILQWERDRSERTYRRLVSRRQLSISKRIARIPPSMHLYDIHITRDLTAMRTVDVGGSGHIYQGVAGGRTLCLKVMRVDNIYDRPNVMKNILREVIPWSRLHHPNIVPFCGVTDQLPGHPGQIALISPWMDNGSIRTFILNHPRCDRFKCVKEIISGLKALHSEEPPIFHRDLKSANILVSGDRTCCIADFGMSSISGSQRVETSGNGDNGAGTLRWRPPEAIMPGNLQSLDPNVASAADVWALGCVIFEIYSGLYPYARYTNDVQAMRANAVKHELPGDLPPACPPVIRTFVMDCWQREPLFRPKLTDLANSRRYPGLFNQSY